MGLNVKGKTIKLLGKSNSGEHLCDLGVGKGLFFFNQNTKCASLKGEKT